MPVNINQLKQFKNYFDSDQVFNNNVSDEKITLILKAYKYNLRMEELSGHVGARDLSPTALADAHYYRTIRRTLQHVLRLMAEDSKSHDETDFTEELTVYSAPDLSLILRESKNQE